MAAVYNTDKPPIYLLDFEINLFLIDFKNNTRLTMVKNKDGTNIYKKTSPADIPLVGPGLLELNIWYSQNKNNEFKIMIIIPNTLTPFLLEIIIFYFCGMLEVCARLTRSCGAGAAQQRRSHTNALLRAFCGDVCKCWRWHGTDAAMTNGQKE